MIDIEELKKRLRDKAQKEASRRNSAYDHYGWDNTPESVMPDEMAICNATDALQAENAALRQELEEAKRDSWRLAEKADSIAGELEEALKDAERYRHMRNNAVFRDRSGPGLYWYLPRFMNGSPAERLDAAIDAEIAEKKVFHGR